MLSAMSGNQLIAPLGSWSRNTWHQYTMLTNAFCKFFHFLVVIHLKRMILKCV